MCHKVCVEIVTMTARWCSYASTYWWDSVNVGCCWHRLPI